MKSRIGFWQVLADEQERKLHMELPDSEATVAMSESEVAAAFDALIGNVFSHTEAGTGFGVMIRTHDGRVEVEVADGGNGFPDGFDPVERGSSGAGSSGLGLDIVQRLARAAGGSMRLGSSHSGGAKVVLEMPTESSDGG
jgi:signal transduction histidine kinase